MTRNSEFRQNGKFITEKFPDSEDNKMKKHIRKLLAAVLALMMVASCMSVASFTAAAESSLTLTEPTFTEDDRKWYDDNVKADTFTISTRGELAYFMELGKNTPVTFVGKTVKLGADIVWNDGEASATGFTAGEDGVIYRWTPYASTAMGGGTNGALPTKWFRGTIDGQGHTISGLCLSGESYQAFICGGAGAKIRNLNLDNMYVEALGTGNVHSAALICRTAYTITIENVHVDVNINTLGSGVGGFVAVQTSYNPKGLNFKNCTVSGNITGNTTSSQYLGGFVGANSLAPTVFTNCASYINITGYVALGGYVGMCCGNTTLTNCSYLGTITAGGIASKTGAFGYLIRQAYQNETDELYSVPESSGTAAITLTDCYFQGGTQCPYAMSVFTTKPWFNVSSRYGSDDPKEIISDNFSTKSPKVNSEALTALCRSLALYGGNTDMISFGYAQLTKPVDGKYDLRLLATLNMDGVEQSAVEEIGFEVKNMYNSDLSQSVVCNSVYESIVSDYGLNTVSASELGADYIASLVVKGISSGSLKGIVARPYIKVSGKTYYGAWLQASVIDGSFCNSASTVPSVG